MLQVFHERARQGGAGEGGPLGHNGPQVRVGSEAGAEHEAASMGVATGAKHEAKRSTKLHSQAGSRRGARGEAEYDAASICRQQARSMKLHT